MPISETVEEIDTKIPFLKSLKNDEDLIRRFQLQIASIKDLKPKRPDFINIVNKIAAQTPEGIIFSNMSFTNSTGKVSLKLTGVAQNNDQLATLIFGLKSDPTFSGITLSSISLD
ncbi:MAG: Uncharacterized protein G01um101493_234, partial [Microgenomates group bacterium Gr01-1014_93]